MFKRIISILMLIVMLLTSVVTLGGCSTQQDDTLTVGQWLGMINNAFGMETYVQEEPYFENIDSNNQYFNTIQIAAEWEVVDVNSAINPEDPLIWKDALITLVNAGNFTSNNASDDEKIQYAIKNFNTTIKTYWMDRSIDVATATSLLIEVQEQWANRTYAQTVSTVDYSEGVLELSESELAYYEVDENDNILMSEQASEILSVGDIFVLPAEGECSTTKVYKVEEITIDDGVAKIITSDDFELGDFVDELYIESTFAPDLTQAEFYDGNGNLLQAGTNGSIESQSNSSTNEYTVTNLTYNSNNNAQVTQLAVKTSFEFEVDGCKVELTKKSDGLSAKIEMPLSEDKKVKGYYEVEISNFEVTTKIDYSCFTLHSAELKIDYKTKSTVGVKKTYVEEKAVYAPKWTNGNGKFLTNLKNSVWKDSDLPGAKTIKIGKITVASIGVASFSVDVYAKLKVDGSIEISCSETGCKGIEYKNGNCRVINTSDKDMDAKFKCKAEGTVSIVPTVNAFGYAILGFKGEMGLGAEASLTLHLADAGNHLLQEIEITDLPPEAVAAIEVTGLTADAEEIKKLAEEQGGTFEWETSTVDLHIDTCIDINVYFILKVGIEEQTLVGKLLKGTKVKITWELCGSKNAKICNLHIENLEDLNSSTSFDISFFTDENLCTLKYTPFDDTTEEMLEETTTIGDGGVEVGEVLVISDMKVVLQVGTSTTISVVQVPKGYELKDVICESSDKSIATINKNGVITAVGEGSTTIIVRTSDGKYSWACAVSVVSEEEENFTPLNYYIRENKAGGVLAA